MIWEMSWKADPRARDVADRHYNRQKPGTPQFVPPGRALEWVCSAFRNEGAGIASEMIREAVAATRAHFGEPPELGMITFIDRRKVKPTMVHGVKTWGRTYELAGFRPVGETKGGLLALQLLPADMPEPEKARERV